MFQLYSDMCRVFFVRDKMSAKKPIALGPACKPLHPVQIKNTLHNNCMCGRSVQLQQDNAGSMTDHLGIYLVQIVMQGQKFPKVPLLLVHLHLSRLPWIPTL